MGWPNKRLMRRPDWRPNEKQTKRLLLGANGKLMRRPPLRKWSLTGRRNSYNWRRIKCGSAPVLYAAVVAGQVFRICSGRRTSSCGWQACIDLQSNNVLPWKTWNCQQTQATIFIHVKHVFVKRIFNTGFFRRLLTWRLGNFDQFADCTVMSAKFAVKTETSYSHVSEVRGQK